MNPIPKDPEIKQRNKNIFGSMISYLSKAKQNLESDDKVKFLSKKLKNFLDKTSTKYSR